MKIKLLIVTLCIISIGLIGYIYTENLDGKSLPYPLTNSSIFNTDLPPDPGKNGIQTLLGIDSDDDGVRDDVQRFISRTYSEDKLLALALTEYAKLFQVILQNTSDRDIAFNNAKKLSAIYECVHYIQGKVEKDTFSGLRAEILNTKERTIAFLKFNNNLAGQILISNPQQKWKESCEFNIDEIEHTQN